MQRTTKKLLGLVGLALVVLLTIFAYLVPSDGAYAEEPNMGRDDLNVTVYGDDQYPSIRIDSPTTDHLTVTPELDITFTYEFASYVDFTVSYIDENGNPVEVALPRFTPDPADLDPIYGYNSDTDTVTVNLRSVGLDYNHYILNVVSGSPIGESTGDSIEFDYAPASLTDTGTTDKSTNDPIVEIAHDDGVKKIEIMPIDKDGNPLLDEPIVVDITPDENGDYPAGKKTVTLPFTSGGLESGEYDILITAYDENDDELESPRDVYQASYVQPIAPDAPNTGSFLGNLNVAESDYILTVAIIFAIASAVAFRLITRKKTNYRKNIK